MKKGIIYIMAVLTLSVVSLTVKAEETSKTLVLTAEDLSSVGAGNLILSFSIGGAKVNITQSDDIEFIVKAEVTFDSELAEPTLKTGTLEDAFTASFATGRVRLNKKLPAKTLITKWDITIGNYDVDTDLIISLGGVSGSIDLGGMPINNCLLSMGGANIDIDFSKPTKRQMETLIITSGGTAFSMANIGNTDFKKFNWSAGGDIAKLDFNGAYKRKQHDVFIAGGGEKLDITVPVNAGEKLNSVSVATAISVTGEGWIKTSRGLGFAFKKYITDDYETRDVLIDFGIAGAGSIVSVNRE